ncbi:MAG TPA: C39 family peptidase [Myxococcaceae bacterium]|jgi:hypothetical protein
MTSIKQGPFPSATLHRLQQQQSVFEHPKAALKTTQPAALPPVVAQLRDTFETVRNQLVDLAGGLVANAAKQAQAGGPTVVNPELQQFLTDNPNIQTVQDFVNYCYGQGGDRFFREKCAELGLDHNALARLRSANMSDYVYSGPELAENLPHTANAANAHFITQFGDPTYNPDGKGSTTNCGPTSLAMALNTAGQMPEGLSPEQQIDYARALMYPDITPTSYVPDTNPPVPQLDQDGEFTDISAITRGAQELELGGLQGTGWAAIDNALAEGKPVVCPGNVSSDWESEFPDAEAYHAEGSGHFIAVLGRTEDGKYLVADPLYEGGVVEMSREQLATFFQGSSNTDPKFAAIG